jgi:PelA/Pel-15E family pectate lyase
MLCLLLAGHALASELPRQRFALLTEERLAACPEPERAAWREYLERSQNHARHERVTLAAERAAAGLARSQPAPGARKYFGFDGKKDAAFFARPEMVALAEVVLSYQTPTGGWSKHVDYSRGPRPPGTHWTAQGGEGWHYCGTLDNRSTTEQIEFLARVHAATGRAEFRDGALCGLEWLLQAQYPNGGWPQNYPLEPGYHEATTLNDGAMQHALKVVLAVSRGDEPFQWVAAPLRQRAAQALARGLACLCRSQVRIGDRLTVWCAQHDPLTLEPVAARLKEPPSLSGAESADLVKFLMRFGPLDDDMRTCIEAALAWFETHQITDLRETTNAAGKADYVHDPASTEVRWARFYDLATERPIFAGAQDGIIYHSFREMAAHNDVAYDYFTTHPRDLLAKEAARWRKRMAK